MKTLAKFGLLILTVAALAFAASPLISETQIKSSPEISLAETPETDPEPTLRWSPEGALLPPLPDDPVLRQEAYDRTQAMARNPELISGAKPLDIEFELQPCIWRPLGKLPLPDSTMEEVRSNGLKAPSTYLNFPGRHMPDRIPPSPDIAVGPDHVMQVVNGEIAIYDKCGVLKRVGYTYDWVEDYTHTFYNAKVTYDHWNKRWLVIVAGRDVSVPSYVLYLLVSSSEDPMEDWLGSVSLVSSSGHEFTGADVGFDPFRIYVTANLLLAGVPTYGPRLWILDSADVYSKLSSPFYSASVFYDPKIMGSWGGLVTPSCCSSFIRTPYMHDYNGEYWLVDSRKDGDDHLTLRLVTFPSAKSPVIWETYTMADPYAVAPPMQQSDGSYLHAGNCSLKNAVQKGNRIWTCMTARAEWGGADDRPAIRVFQINCLPDLSKDLDSWGPWITTQTTYGAAGVCYAYPSVDVEPGAFAIVSFSSSSPNDPPGAGYIDFYPNGNFGTERVLHEGVADFKFGGSGTASDPHEWGRFTGVQLDPWDETSLWFTGPYGNDRVYPPEWSTQIGVISFEGGPHLTVRTGSPDPLFETEGYFGGPFSPAEKEYIVENSGGAAMYWDVIGLPPWLTWNLPAFGSEYAEMASPSAGKIKGGGQVIMRAGVNEMAETYPPGVYETEIEFRSCNATGTTGALQTVRLIVHDEQPICPGAETALAPEPSPLPFGTPGHVERGVEFRPLKDYVLRCVGIQLASAVPADLTASLYQGAPRSAATLLWQDTFTITDATSRTHFLQLDPSAVLEACETYELAFDVGEVTNLRCWPDYNLDPLPFDADGLFRIDNLTEADADGHILLQYTVVGHTIPGCPFDGELVGPGPYPASIEEPVARGTFITALRTLRCCKLGIYGDFPVGAELRAAAFRRSDDSRGAFIRKGTWLVDTPGPQWHDIPLKFIMREGRDYDLTVSFDDVETWEYQAEADVVLPFEVNGVIEVVDGEAGGLPDAEDLPRTRIFYANYPDPCDTPGKSDYLLTLDPEVPLSTSAEDSLARGFFFTALEDIPLFGVGWMSSLPKKAPIVARLYSASGGVRDSLITESLIQSGGEEEFWHTFPMAAQLNAGDSYDLEITWYGTTKWRYWDGSAVTFPFDVDDAIRITSPEADGIPGDGELLQVRLHTLPSSPSAIGYDPVPHRQKGELSVFPSPFNASTTLEVAVSRSAEIQLTVFDARGRSVRELWSGRKGFGVHPFPWDGSDNSGNPLGSGVYFARLVVNGEVAATEKLVLLK